MSESQIDLSAIPFEITETDRENLLAGDERFTPHSWDELKQIIAENNLSILKRKPSDLIRYIKWTDETKAAYGSMTNFVCQERLYWQPLPDSDGSGPSFECTDERPFASRDDYKVLRNDWPYGFELGITHLVVWLKTKIPVQQPDGYLLPESKSLVESFVQTFFADSLKRAGISADDKIQWFKNWVSLQSVRSLDHFHVLVRDVPQSILDEWTSNT